MTKTLTLRNGDIAAFPPFQKFGIGFDSVFDEILRVNERQANNAYPPYNIISIDDDHFSIELAVAGFREGEIEIQMEKGQLTITGKQAESATSDTIKYLVHGISSRSFIRTFSLAEYVIVKDASIANGILLVNVERKVPESAKPKLIKIDHLK
jgi:molecular chaperone IbpA